MLKVTNNTRAKLWISDFCFVPGESTVKSASEDQVSFIKNCCENNEDIKELIKNKDLVFEWEDTKKGK